MTRARPYTIDPKNGFVPLGEITVTPDHKTRFPTPPLGSGLYFIGFKSGGYYVGETDRFLKVGKRTARFDDYTNPADDVWTELVVNKMLLWRGGGYVHVRPVADSTKQERRAMEREVVADLRMRGIPLWNAGRGRCERSYLQWKIPIMEDMLATAVERYAPRGDNLTDYVRKRLVKLPRAIGKSRAAYTALESLQGQP